MKLIQIVPAIINGQQAFQAREVEHNISMWNSKTTYTPTGIIINWSENKKGKIVPCNPWAWKNSYNRVENPKYLKKVLTKLYGCNYKLVDWSID